jgi:hypothetical protein
MSKKKNFENPMGILDDIEDLKENRFPLTKPSKTQKLDLDIPISFVTEMNNIMKFFGRKYNDGDVRGTHLGKVLFYLIMNQSEDYDDTQYKLALSLGVAPRLIRENYLKGFEKFKIINVFTNGDGAIVWEWRGIPK